VVQSLQEFRALIVDDNATNLKILSHQIGSWGMSYDETDSGSQALQLLRSATASGVPYDLVLLDFMMPGMDGFELARTIKADSKISEVRLILLTSGGQRGDGAKAREAGIAAYLTKPVRKSQLFDCLTAVLSKSPVVPESSNPLKTAPADLITTHSLREAKGVSHKLILLAEDNVVNQKVAIRQLQKLGYRADAVANGREALEALSRISYDLVLMDCQMPEMDGYEATAEIRRLEGRGRHTPIVAMTAHALAGDRERSLAAGMDDHITKPVKPEELSTVLERLLTDTGNGSKTVRVLPRPPLTPVDLKRLHEAMGDEPEELLEILGIYLTQMAESIDKIETAVKLGNAGDVDLIAHNCAGTSANCGMIAIVAPLRELELVARERSLDEALPLVEQIRAEFKRIMDFVQTELQIAVVS
jgi:two-component system, sensor histidine kinase and response regulator